VIKISGLERVLSIQNDVASALGPFTGRTEDSKPARVTSWRSGEVSRGDRGRITVLPGDDAPSFLEIAGDINDVLTSTVSPRHIFSKPFSRKAYSIGLGGLGETLDDYYRLMGEMITIGGSMVWLPCDGYGMPDFLIPKHDEGQVLMRSGFNVSLSGAFNEYLLFESTEPEGTTVADVYRALFDHARRRRPDYKGALGLAMRAEMPALFGAGVVKAPVIEHRPPNGLLITDPSNFAEWFEFDREPRHRHVTGLIAGCGVDLTTDHSAFTPETFARTFYINPANRGSADLALHNHVVAFDAMPMPADDFTLESEITRVLDEGEFRDMRHMLDASTIARAVIGVLYVQDFVDDSDYEWGHVVRGEDTRRSG
jgi:hypothetical protein